MLGQKKTVDAACADQCNHGGVTMRYPGGNANCQLDDSGECTCTGDWVGPNDVECNGEDTTETGTEDNTVCSATCWANGVNNSNVVPDVDAPYKTVDIVYKCQGSIIDRDELAQNVTCNTYSCSSQQILQQANDAGNAV